MPSFSPELKLDGKSLQFQFAPQELIKAVPEAFTSEQGTATAKLLSGAIGSFAKMRKPEQLAAEWVIMALVEAFRKIWLQKNLVPSMFRPDIKTKIVKKDFTITADIFEIPHKLPLLNDFKLLLESFLINIPNTSDTEARALATQLPRYFADALADTWDNKYEPVRQYFNNPTFPYQKRRAQFRAYQDSLKQEFDKKNIFASEHLLKDLYVSPQAMPLVWREGEKDESNRDLRKHQGFDKEQKQDFHAFAHEWVRGKCHSNKKVLVLLGNPGQGKSSFCLKFLAELYEAPKEIPVYLVPLRYVTDRALLLNNPYQQAVIEINRNSMFTDEPHRVEEGLIIFDGLDEISMHEAWTDSQVCDFIRRCNQSLPNGSNLRVMVTSRSIYVPLDHLDPERDLVWRIAPMEIEQQKLWLKQYKALGLETQLTEADLEHIAKNKVYKNAQELAEEPLLLQLLALANIPLSKEMNKAQLYNAVLDGVIEREMYKDRWNTKDKKTVKIAVRTYLQELAFHIAQSEHEYVHKVDFEKEDLKSHTEAFIEAVNAKHLEPIQQTRKVKDFKDILTAFYVVQVPTLERDKGSRPVPNVFALQFVHKSLQEFLAAEKIWHWFKGNDGQFMEQNTNGKYWLNTTEAVLGAIWKLFSPKMMSKEVAHYLLEHIRNDLNDSAQTEHLKKVRARLHSFFSDLVQHQFLYKYEATSDSHEALPFDKALRTFYGYWLVTSALLWPDEVDFLTQTHLKWMENRREINEGVPSWWENEFKAWKEKETQARNAFYTTAKYKGQNAGELFKAQNPIETVNKTWFVHLIHLFRRHYTPEFIEWGEQKDPETGFERNVPFFEGHPLLLSFKDLRGAYLRGADLRGAYLIGAYLIGADLRGAYLRGAYLRGADLRGGYLRGADLSGASLSGADLRGADLRGADLRGVYLIGADLSGADLSGADLIGAYLSGAYLIGADLSGADLRGADLSGADLIGTDLSGANLSGADLSGADLSEANFMNAILKDGIYGEVKLGYDPIWSKLYTLGAKDAFWAGTIYAEEDWRKAQKEWEEEAIQEGWIE